MPASRMSAYLRPKISSTIPQCGTRGPFLKLIRRSLASYSFCHIDMTLLLDPQCESDTVMKSFTGHLSNQNFGSSCPRANPPSSKPSGTHGHPRSCAAAGIARGPRIPRRGSSRVGDLGGDIDAGDDFLLDVGGNGLIPLQLHAVLCAPLGHPPQVGDVIEPGPSQEAIKSTISARVSGKDPSITTFYGLLIIAGGNS
jgi:hypothetical protein